MTGGLDVSAHTVFVISLSHYVQVRFKPAVYDAQSVKLDPCFACGALSPGGEFAKLEIYGYKAFSTPGQ